jgi:hypothetical protein
MIELQSLRNRNGRMTFFGISQMTPGFFTIGGRNQLLAKTTL